MMELMRNMKRQLAQQAREHKLLRQRLAEVELDVASSETNDTDSDSSTEVSAYELTSYNC